MKMLVSGARTLMVILVVLAGNMRVNGIDFIAIIKQI